MKVAEVTAAQAANLDPALLPPDDAIAIRVNGVRAVIGRTPTGFGDVLVGELRTDDDRPMHLRSVGNNVTACLRVAPNTGQGLGQILTELTRLASQRRRAS